MFVNYKNKVIFCRTPKTASTSILATLRPHIKMHRACDIKNFPYDKNHIPLKDICSSKPDLCENYFKFSFTRNPWCRAVSIWKMTKRSYPKLTPSFTEFVSSLENLTWLPAEGPHAAPPKEVFQYKYVNVIDFAKGCDFIGRFENLQEDFDYICDKIKIPRQKLLSKNRSPEQKPYVDYYNRASREIIAARYSKDIEYFGYEFGA